MTKSKPSALRPPKKHRSKLSAPETADDFQEAADREEETGGKWRVGDPSKSGRAFVRALDVYDQALARYPANFDLAYNKARLELEITQQPALVEHIGLPLIELLRQTLESHRVALKIKDDVPDVLFNTSQVLTSLAEQLSEEGDSRSAVLQLQEALELLSACLSRQEMLLEQQRVDFQEAQDTEDGGVQLDSSDEKPASSTGSEPVEQAAMVEVPVSATDLLDTIHASLSALTTLVPLTEESGLENLGNMAEALTEKRAAYFLTLLPEDTQDSARFSIGLDRASFVAAFADAQYNFNTIELETYRERLNVSFDLPGKLESAQALSTEGEARTELVLSAFDLLDDPSAFPAEVLWKQLTLAQDLYTKATKLPTDDAKERKSGLYKLKGDIELLRTRLALLPNANLDPAIPKSAPTLIGNACTYYKGAAQLARTDGDDDLRGTAMRRWLIATDIGAALFDVRPKELPSGFDPGSIGGDLVEAVVGCVDEGLVDAALGEQIVRRISQQQ